jgi:hypothetical protein
MIRKFRSPRLTVPDNVVKQISEGRPMMLALLCGGLRTRYTPVADNLPTDILEALIITPAAPERVTRQLVSRGPGAGHSNGADKWNSDMLKPFVPNVGDSHASLLH